MGNCRTSSFMLMLGLRDFAGGTGTRPFVVRFSWPQKVNLLFLDPFCGPFLVMAGLPKAAEPLLVPESPAYKADQWLCECLAGGDFNAGLLWRT